jgi:hypothetical protein
MVGIKRLLADLHEIGRQGIVALTGGGLLSLVVAGQDLARSIHNHHGWHWEWWWLIPFLIGVIVAAVIVVYKRGVALDQERAKRTDGPATIQRVGTLLTGDSRDNTVTTTYIEADEPPDREPRWDQETLQRECEETADQISDFLDERHKVRPDPSLLRNREALDAINAYDTETEMLFRRRFGGKLRVIYEELRIRALIEDHHEKLALVQMARVHMDDIPDILRAGAIRIQAQSDEATP